MAQIETKKSEKHDLTLYTIKGEVNGDEIIEKIRQELTEKHTSLIIWDFSGVEQVDLPIEKMYQILTIGKKLSEIRKFGKTAIVVPQDLGFGLGRMYEAYSEIEVFPTENRAFRTMEQACEWLGISSL